jgi:hypothetical protein
VETEPCAALPAVFACFLQGFCSQRRPKAAKILDSSGPKPRKYSGPLAPSGWPSRSLGEAGEVIESAGDEPLAARVLSLGGGGEQLEKVPRARSRFGARRGGSRIEKILQFCLATSQRRLVNLNIVKLAADLSISLSGYATVPVKIDRLVRHDLGAFTRDPGRSLGGGSAALGGAAADFGLADLGFLGSRFPRL